MKNIFTIEENKYSRYYKFQYYILMAIKIEQFKNNFQIFVILRICKNVYIKRLYKQNHAYVFLIFFITIIMKTYEESCIKFLSLLKLKKNNCYYKYLTQYRLR